MKGSYLPGAAQFAGEEALRLISGATEREWAAIRRTRLPILIQGETGAGKSRLARELHALVGGESPLVEVNIAAIPSALLSSELYGHERGAFTGAHASRTGLAALANGGTLFLDEIGELGPEAQVQLLSFLDDGRYRPVGSARELQSTARVIAATNRDLQRAVAQGLFRADLYHRLASISIRIRPLREQRVAIPDLARALLAEAAARHGLPTPHLGPDALQVLDRHSWPGNVRELRFLLERMVVSHGDTQVSAADVLSLLHVHEAPHTEDEVVRPLADLEREMVARALRVTGGNRTQAARLLGITPRGLYNKLENERLTPARGVTPISEHAKVVALPLAKAEREPAA